MTDASSIEIGVLRVLTLDDDSQVALHGAVIENHYPHVTTRSRCIPDHPNGIPGAAAEADALPRIIELGTELAKEVDVLTVSCALDPGVDELNEAVDIPVIGAGASVAGAALARGQHVGTLGLEGGTAAAITDRLGDRLRAKTTVHGAETTNFLTTVEGRDAIRAAIRRLTDAGCDVIAPSCTGITTSGVLPNAQDVSDVPIINPVVAMGAIATTAVHPPEPTAKQSNETSSH